jgi:hypothetical protein
MRETSPKLEPEKLGMPAAPLLMIERVRADIRRAVERRRGIAVVAGHIRPARWFTPPLL